MKLGGFLEQRSGVTCGHFRELGIIVAICVVAACWVVPLAQARGNSQSAPEGQTADGLQTTTAKAVLQGRVRDASGKPAAEALVTLRRTGTGSPEKTTQSTRTNSEGIFRFSGLSDGTYAVRVQGKSVTETVVSSVTMDGNETKSIDLTLAPVATEASSKPPEFFDEPQFTVAGVAPASNSGGHGSDTVLRNSEALVRETGSLSKDSTESSNLEEARANIQKQLAGESEARDDEARQHYADLHHRLGQIQEKLGDPLEAVREYQRAAELAPSETNLFDWGSELLTHRALEPATDVFAKGNQLYPQSVRMLIGMGVAWYARGAYDRATQYLGNASDLAPRDSTPYLFLGRMQSVENVASKESMERLARFQSLQPGSALANYYYAVGLWKANGTPDSSTGATFQQVEVLLQKAVQLDSKLGPAHLQLGILYAQAGDYAHAIAEYQKAVDVSPDLEETHYRLAQAYRRTGDVEKAKEQLQLHEQISKQTKERAEQERREIQQFVISLRDKAPDSQSQPHP